MALPVEAVRAPIPREGVDNATETARLLRELREFAGRFRQQSFTWQPAAIPVNQALAATFSNDGDGHEFRDLRVGMPIIVTPPSVLPAGLELFAQVSATDTVTVRVTNHTGGTATPPSGSWQLWGYVLPGLSR